MYRIYTEDRNRSIVTGILDAQFPGYTLFTAQGVWESVPENSLVIEVAGVKRAEVLAVAESIRVANLQANGEPQSAVMVAEIPATVLLVSHGKTEVLE